MHRFLWVRQIWSPIPTKQSKKKKTSLRVKDSRNPHQDEDKGSRKRAKWSKREATQPSVSSAIGKTEVKIRKEDVN